MRRGIARCCDFVFSRSSLPKKYTRRGGTGAPERGGGARAPERGGGAQGGAGPSGEGGEAGRTGGRGTGDRSTFRACTRVLVSVTVVSQNLVANTASSSCFKQKSEKFLRRTLLPYYRYFPTIAEIGAATAFIACELVAGSCIDPSVADTASSRRTLLPYYRYFPTIAEIGAAATPTAGSCIDLAFKVTSRRRALAPHVHLLCITHAN